MFALRAPLRAVRAMSTPIARTPMAAAPVAGRRFYHDKDKSCYTIAVRLRGS